MQLEPSSIITIQSFSGVLYPKWIYRADRGDCNLPMDAFKLAADWTRYPAARSPNSITKTLFCEKACAWPAGLTCSWPDPGNNRRKRSSCQGRKEGRKGSCSMWLEKITNHVASCHALPLYPWKPLSHDLSHDPPPPPMLSNTLHPCFWEQNFWVPCNRSVVELLLLWGQQQHNDSSNPLPKRRRGWCS